MNEKMPKTIYAMPYELNPARLWFHWFKVGTTEYVQRDLLVQADREIRDLDTEVTLLKDKMADLQREIMSLDEIMP